MPRKHRRQLHRQIVGSYSNRGRAALYEVTTLRSGEGFPIRSGWLNAM